MKKKSNIINSSVPVILLLICFIFTAAPVFSQNCIGIGGVNSSTYTTNFDALGSSPAPQNSDAANIFNITAVPPAATSRFIGKFDNAVNDAGGTVNFPGWAIVEEGAVSTTVSGRYNVGNGSIVGENTYSFANAAAPLDRALGSQTDGNLSASYLGSCFNNTTGNAISTVYINYTGELWRRGDVVGDRLAFEYAVKPSGTTPTQTIFGGAFTSVPALDFVTSSTTGTGAGQRDGNAAANRTVFPVTAVAVTIPAGQSLYIRWADSDVGGAADDGLAIDDFRISLFPPTAAQANLSGRVTSPRKAGIANARVTLTDTKGESRTATTNPFGYYRFNNVPIGDYIISIRSKRFSFNNNVVFLSVTADAENVDFVASH